MEAAASILDLVGIDGLFGLTVIFQCLTVYLIYQVWRTAREGRSDIHKRMDDTNANMVAHERVCAERWGEIRTKLEQINECYTKHEHNS